MLQNKSIYKKLLFMKYSLLIILLVGLGLACTPSQKISKDCSTIGTVKDFTGLDGCKMLIVLEDGSKIEPAIIEVKDFELKDGQKVKFGYELAKDFFSVCMGGTLAIITCIEEVP